MADEPQPSAKPQFTAEVIRQQFKTLASWVDLANAFAQELDWLGDAKEHPEGSEKRALAEVRDEVDRALSMLLVEVKGKCASGRKRPGTPTFLLCRRWMRGEMVTTRCT